MDPRTFKDKSEWDWAELNAYHTADVARQILTDIDDAIADTKYLRKKERGEQVEGERDWSKLWQS